MGQKYVTHNSLLPFYLAWQINSNNPHYNVNFSCKIKQKKELSLLIKKLQELIKLKPHLRQTFALEENELIAAIHNELPPEINHFTSNHEDFPKLEKELMNKPFAIDTNSSVRLNVINFEGDNEYTLIFSIHHILIDGYSFDNFIIELNTLLANKEIASESDDEYISRLSLQFPLKDEIDNLLIRYIEDINNISGKIEFFPTNEKSSVLFYADVLPVDIAKDLTIISERYQITSFNLLLLAWGIYISKIYNQSYTLINYPVNIRTDKTIDGCFVNMVTLPLDLSLKDTYASVITSWREKIHILKCASKTNLNGKLNLGHTINFAYSTLASPHQLHIKDKSYPFIGHPQIAHSKLSLKYRQHADKLFFNCEILEGLFPEYFALTVLPRFFNYLKKLLSDPTQALVNSDLLFSQERKQLLYDFNNSHKPYPENKTLVDLFEEQVEKNPDNIAIVYKETTLTYRKLNKLSNQLAQYLKNKYHIKSDDLLALCMNRSEYMLIAIIAVLKTSGAYVPIDPDYPEERIAYILQDTKARVTIASQTHKDKLILVTDKTSILKTTDILFLDTVETQNLLLEQTGNNLKQTNSNNNLAYVIYTSGTSGKPKGVMIEHRSVVSLISGLFEKYQIENNERFILFANYVFDASVEQIILALVSGNTLHVLSSEHIKNIEYFENYLVKHAITHLHVTPSFLENLDPLKLKNLNRLIVGAEIFSKQLLNKYLGFVKKVVNEYGPTEATITSLFAINSNHIGKPTDNTQAFILDAHENLLPIGCIGELFIGGVQLARGYLNLSDLMAEKFISNRFQTEEEKKQGKNTRLYKTGDLVRYLPDGNIEYIGRNDFQIKIRGYRIELGEIEFHLTNYPALRWALVLAHKSTDNLNDTTTSQRLVAYYLADDKLNELSLLEYLSKHLPEYMLPSAFIYLEKLPLTINGKLDHKALPTPDFTGNAKNHVMPRTELEVEISAIYAEVLNLSVEQIGITDDFFMLGGNSILAIKLVNKLKQALELKITIATIFKFKTIAGIIKNLLLEEAGHIVIPQAVLDPDIKVYPLSFAQERIWFIEQYETDINAYNIPMFFKIADEVNLDHLKQSFLSIIDRHQILRSFIKTDVEGHAYQVIQDLVLNPLIIHSEILANHEELAIALKKEANYRYDLECEYPIRLRLYENSSDSSHYLSFTIHHIAFDGWSIDVLLHELGLYYDYYQTLSQGKKAFLNLPVLSIQYKDFAIWQRSHLTDEHLRKELNYWSQKLKDFETLNLPIDKPRPSEIDYKGTDVYFILDEFISIKLRAVAKELKVSLYSVLLSGFYLLLRSYSNQNDIVIGTPIANRNYTQIENLIGFFVNSLALRVVINPEVEIIEFIKLIGHEVISAQLHQDLPFEKLVEELDVQKDTSRHPVFQVMFGVQGFGDKALQNVNNVDRVDQLLSHYEVEDSYQVAKFDLTTMIDDSQSQLKGSFNYATSLFNKDTITNMVNTFVILLEQLADLNTNQLSQIKIKQLTYLKQDDYQRITNNWNKPDEWYPNDKVIHQLFEEQAERTPDNIAIVYQDKQLTYKQLNEQSNQLAHYLKENYQVKPDDLIGLCLDRSIYTLIGILSVLKAGAAYVPIDPNYPDKRIKYIFEDTQAKVILVNKKYCHKFLSGKSLNNDSLLIIDNEETRTTVEKYPIANPDREVTSNHLAYVIYTSGTTGQPKGVLQLHGNVIRLFTATEAWYEFNENDVWTLFHSYIFDFSVWEIWGALFNGGKLVIASYEETRDLESFYRLCSQHKVTVLNQTPSVFYQFMDISLAQSQFKKIKLNDLRYIIFGGEALNISQLTRWFNHYGYEQPKLINMYGITETTVHVTYKPLAEHDINNSVSIGNIIPDQRAYILNENMLPLPVGAIGELYIGGAGLARGYLNRPELTTERFIANPFQSNTDKQLHKNAKLYKTGDLARWLSDGTLAYMGRNDFQVKIRGYRIELGEIEARLSSYPGIKQSAVLAYTRKDNTGHATNHKYLVGYYVAETLLDEESILSYLALRLPEYMLPSILIHLEKLPSTINGKLDHKALPIPEFTHSDSFIPPRNELESKVCGIYAEILGLEISKVGIADDFFRLGGDSIVSIQVVSKLRQRLGLNVTIKDIFNYKSIGRLFDNVISKSLMDEQKLLIKAEQGFLSGEVNLLPIQKWFFEQKFRYISYWNQSFLIKTPELNIKVLKASLSKLIEYHDSFRLRYKRLGDANTMYSQYYMANLKVEDLKILDVESLNSKEGSAEFYQALIKKLTHWQSKLDLESGPLYSVGYVHGYQDGSSRIFFALHHLIIDTVSWRILTDDLHTIYNNLMTAQLNDNLESALLNPVSNILGSKGTSYRQWVEFIATYKNKYLDEIQYWTKIVEDHKDAEKSIKKLMESDVIQNSAGFALTKIYTQQLLQRANSAYNTQINDLLLTAFSYALYDLTKHTVNYIVLEGHGRENLDKELDISRTAGWFTTMYPVRLEIISDSKDQTNQHNLLGTNIKNIKEILRSVPNKGIGYGAIIGLNEKYLPKISFNYLGQFDKSNSNNWNIINEESGVKIHPENLDSNILHVNGMVINGKLEFSVLSKMNQTLTRKLARSFKENLENVLSHTVQLTRKYLTTSDIDNIISIEYLDKLQQESDIDSVYLANSLQQGFIYHALNQGDMDDAYLVQIIWEYHHQINLGNLRLAWEYAVVKFPSLRLRFAYDDELVQVINSTFDINWEYLDFSNKPEEIQKGQIKKLQIEDRRKPYDLKVGNLFRVYIIKQSEKLYTCLFSSHHAIMDGWSLQVLLDYIHDMYLQIERDKSSNKKQTVLVEHAYESTQRYLQNHQSDHEEYWLAYIKNLEEQVDLNGLLKAERRNFKLNEYRYILDPKEQELKIADKLYQNLKRLSHIKGITMNAVIHYVWHKVLAIYSNASSTIVGTTISGRNLPIDDLETSVGLYINTLPLIVRHDSRLKIIDIIKQVQSDIHETNARSNVNLAKLQNKGERLFDTLFVFENYPMLNKTSQSLKIEIVDSIEKHDYPLCVMAYEKDNALFIKFKYAGELFASETIISILKQVQYLVEQIVQDIEMPSSKLQLLYPEQYQQIVYEWNRTEEAYQTDKTIHQIFEEQVIKHPDRIAVKFEDKELTYAQLNTEANQLANYIRQEYQIKPDDLIALCIDRSEYVLVAILAILKSGGAYVPIDPDYPDDRISYILNDIKAKLILTNKKHYHKIEQLGFEPSKIIVIENEDTQIKTNKQKKSNPPVLATQTNLAYVIYTSGTTGNPKGVLIEHKSVVNYINNIKNKIFESGSCVVDYSTNIGFDLTVTTTICSLCSGYTISVYPGTLHDIDDYQKYLLKNKVNIIKLVPSYFELLTNNLPKTQINIVILGGEKVPASLLDRINKTDLIIYDEYGPTETTVGTCLSEIYSDRKLSSTINNIGKPYSNYKAYVLDDNLNPLPIGAIGELYIGGVGLSRGYLNLPALTAEKFIHNPFQSQEEKIENGNTKLYKTGDRVRWLSDGSLAYLGRNDFQIKLRGFRVELGEIEHALQKHGDIAQAAVIVKDKGNTKELIAYIVANEFIPSSIEIREFLEEKIPLYMIPDHYVILESLPLTMNSKLDRKALSEREVDNIDNYAPPENELEAKICKIWAEVLGLAEEKVGINDDFFRQGGDSILAIRLVSKINKLFPVQIKVKDIFTLKTIRSLNSLFEHEGNFSHLEHLSYAPFSLIDVNNYINKIDLSLIEDIYPISYLQMGMLLESSLNDKGTYHTVTLYNANFKFDESKFLSIWNDLKNKHELLRASFEFGVDGNYYTFIYKNTNLDYICYKNVSLNQMIEQESKIDFDFSKPGLFRLIVSIYNDRFDFIFSAHHAIEDGWSVSHLMNEFVQAYLNDKPILKKETDLRYGEFIQYEQLALKDQEAENFWKSYLADAEFTSAKWKFNSINESRNGLYSSLFSLDVDESKLIHKVAKANSIGVDSVFLYAYLKAISFFLNTTDITIGLVVNNRLEKIGGDELFGLFLNTIPYRFKVDNLKTIDEGLLEVFNIKTELYKHKYMPYAKFKSLFKHDIFEFVFNFVHFHILEDSINKMNPSAGHERTNIPFSFSVIQRGSTGFNVIIRAHDNFIDQSYLDYFSKYLKIILLNIIKNQSETLLDRDDHQKLVYEWNKSNKKYRADITIHELFEEQVKKTPNNIALIYKNTKLTYQDLNQKANQLTHYLKEQCKIKPDDLIILCLMRDEYMLIAMLAVLKAGGAYVPTDPSYPDKRISYIMQDTKAQLILTNEIYQTRLEKCSLALEQKSLTTKVIAIDSPTTQGSVIKEIKANLTSKSNNKNLAYVIYTSGTTGQPKGVMIEHHSVANLAAAHAEAFGLAVAHQAVHPQEVKNCLWFSNYVFDAHVSELFSSLLYGHIIHIINDEVRQDFNLLANYIKNNNIAVATLPPAILTADHIINLETLIVAGERAEQTILDKYLQHEIKVINAYGPTEATVCATLNNYNGRNSVTNIGKSIQNVKCYVLDKNLNLLPIGAIGELHIGGVGIARGYLNLRPLTSDRFITNPFQTKEDKIFNQNERLYKTGDLVRWLPEGCLEYIGRNDLQVKIHGFRIELGEIENILGSYPGIKQAVVLAQQHNNSRDNKYLVGYYVAEVKLNEPEILSYLAEHLPKHMLPSVLIHLENIPLTINGKLDKESLPKAEFVSACPYFAPRHELEAQVCAIYAKTLGLETDRVGIQDDFFRLGGDSITSIRLVSKLREKLGLYVTVKDIFTYKNIQRLYDSVLSKLPAQKIELKSEQGLLYGESDLLPIQEWFFKNNFANPHHWNQSFLIKVPNLDVARLEASIEKLIFQHDAFRFRYKNYKPLRKTSSNQTKQPVQYYSDISSLKKLKVFNINSLSTQETDINFTKELNAILTDWQSNFDLESGPLYCIAYIHGYSDGTARVYFALHHLLIDVVSWQILINDLQVLYKGNELGSKGSSYRQWVKAVHDYKNTHLEESHYWSNIMSDYHEAKNQLESMLDSENSKIIVNLSLTQQETTQLLQVSNATYHTQINDLLLTALAMTLSQLGPIKNKLLKAHHILLEGHGREEIANDIDITKAVGWFTTQYPVRLVIENIEDIANNIKQIKEILRNIPNNGIGYGALIGYEPSELPKISFNYLGQLDSEKSHDDFKNKLSWILVEEPSGISIDPKNQDHNILSINGSVLNGKLSFNIASKFNKLETENFANNFFYNLKNIISHTIAETRSYLTISDIDKIVNTAYLDKLQQDKEISSVYMANSLQQGLIYHELNQGDVDDAYRVQIIWQYKNLIRVASLKQAWEYAQTRYPTLRLRLAYEEELIQVIDKVGKLDFRYVDFSEEKDLALQELQIKRLQEQDRKERYDLNTGNLFRVYLIKQNVELHTCIFSSHHAILDGWSNPILLNYIHSSYIYIENNEHHLIDRTVDHSYEFAQKYLQENNNKSNEYWNQYLSSLEEKNDLSGLMRHDLKKVRLNEYKHVLDPQEQDLVIKNLEYQALKKMSEEYGITLNAILQYAWHKVLSLYAHTNQTVVGMTVSGRSIPIDHIENSVGFYINTLPIIVDHTNSAQSILEILKSIQTNINEINDRSNINLSKLHHNGIRLFDTLFVYENYPKLENENARIQLNIQFKEVIEKLDYPLAVIAYEINNELVFKLKYAGELFLKETIGRLLTLVELLLKQIIKNPDQLCHQLSYLDETKYHEIITNWNQTESECPSDKTIQALFEDQVKRTPNNIAVVFENNRLTYHDLNIKANQLANYLKEKYHVTPNDLIALCNTRSEYMLIAILAVLKAGAAYVPLDPTYPDERIKYILEDTQAKIVLMNAINIDKFNNKESVLLIDSEELQSTLKGYSALNPEIFLTSDHLAYVIYTSGTTGQPKGVMIEHNSVINTIYSLYNIYDFNLGNKVTAFTSYVFDVSVSEFFTPLFKGAELHIFSEAIKLDPEAISNYLLNNNINYVYLPPILLSSLPRIDYRSLIAIIYAGEPCDRDTGKYWSNKYKLYNYYGPTEATIYALGKRVLDGDVELIGKPISNVTAYVLDNNLNPLPLSAVGELYIGGAGLARGYLNKSELTKEKFISNPLQSQLEKQNSKNARLYKTGDLVRFLPDGNLQYIGRNDLQVKLRGFRIELGEIESVLCNYPDITQSVVVACEHVNTQHKSTENKYLAGYYVSKNRLDEKAILDHLSQHLPDYMMPNLLVYLEKLPLTVNGKLDRYALPNPEFKSLDLYVPPRNQLEAKVCEIYAKTLGLPADNLGITDDFFRLGGDSILSIQLVSRLRQKLEINISVKDIFTYRTIKQLFDHLINKQSRNQETVTVRTEQGVLSGEVALLPIQEWFFEQKFSEPNHWNQSFIIKVPLLKIEQLTASLNKLVEYHDAFKLRYELIHGTNEYRQYYVDKIELEQLRTLNIGSLKHKEGSVKFEGELNNILTSWQGKFNLQDGPLYSIGYIYGYKDGSSRIYFALHHLIADAVSWRILTEDLRQIYSGKELGAKTSSYRQWVNAVKNYASKNSVEKSYWLNVIDALDEHNLTKLVKNKEVKTSTDLVFTKEQTQQLLRETSKAYNTQINDLLLTALGYGLFELTQSEINHALLEGHGREEIDSQIDITRTLGWFTTMYPVQLKINKDLGLTIKQIKENLRHIPNKGIGYGVLIGYKSKKPPKIIFNYLGQFDEDPTKNVEHWNIVNENSGQSMSKNNIDNSIININGLILDGQLRFKITTSLEQLDLMKFSNGFKNSLESIVNHCANKQITEYTMSDFDDYESHVVFNEEKKVKLFMLPPANGGAESYFDNIVPLLSDLNLIIFNNFYRYLNNKISKENLTHLTYESLAHDYISTIKKIQPTGPYHFFGWSFGGVLAVEIAKQLTLQGDKIESIILIDSYFDYKRAAIEAKTGLPKKIIEDVNYKYQPLAENEKLDLEAGIILFKALRYADSTDPSFVDEDIKKIMKYYTENTKSNYLDRLLEDKKFKIITMNIDHENWIKDNAQLEIVSQEILNLVKIKSNLETA